jgi:hypothetical protein
MLEIAFGKFDSVESDKSKPLRGAAMKSNRKHKDGLFFKYFQEKFRLIELYNALANTNYPMDEVLNMLNVEFKLEDALAVRFEEGREEGAKELAALIQKGYSVDEALNFISKKEKS